MHKLCRRPGQPVHVLRVVSLASFAHSCTEPACLQSGAACGCRRQSICCDRPTDARRLVRLADEFQCDDMTRRCDAFLAGAMAIAAVRMDCAQACFCWSHA